MKDTKKLIKQYFPINVSWHVTFKCNYNCSFCFRPDFGEECNYQQAKKIIDKLAKAGLKKISWGGGEPLLWPKMISLIRYTHKKGIITMLITNGELITPKILSELVGNLDWLNLPLDGSNDVMQDLMTRKKGHFKRTINLIRYIREHNLPIKLKINTVASRINKDDIINIVNIIKHWQINRWKVFQFYPIRNVSRKNKVIFNMKESDFLRIKEEIVPLFWKSSQMVVFETNSDMERSYFAIAPSGKVYVSYKGKDHIVGDLKTDSVELIWEDEILDKVKYWERSKWVLSNK